MSRPTHESRVPWRVVRGGGAWLGFRQRQASSPLCQTPLAEPCVALCVPERAPRSGLALAGVEGCAGPAVGCRAASGSTTAAVGRGSAL